MRTSSSEPKITQMLTTVYPYKYLIYSELPAISSVINGTFTLPDSAQAAYQKTVAGIENSQIVRAA